MKALFFLITPLLLLLSSCDKYDPNKERIEDDFNFILTDTAGVTADGSTYIGLKLSNTKKVKDNLTVSFETNKGTILEKEVPYLNNNAQTKLLLAQDTGVYSIKATLKDGSTVRVQKFITVTFPAGLQAQDFSIDLPDSAGVKANGIDIITVRFTPRKTLKPGLVVHFEANKGSLLQSDLPSENGAVETKLTVAQDTGIYVLKAQLKDGSTVKVEKSVLFTVRRARTQNILYELNTSSWTAANPIVIKTTLTRNDGKVTTGEPAFFRAFQLTPTNNDTVSVGRFEGLLNNTANQQGQLTDVKLFLDTQPIDVSKPIGIQIKAIDDRGDTLRRTVFIPHQ